MQTNLLMNHSVYTCSVIEKNVLNYQVASTSIIRYKTHRGRCTAFYAISVKQSQKSESTFKNTNMFEGQLQLARSMTLSASTNLRRPETQSGDTLLMYVNPPTFISINPSVLLYFSFQPG